MSKKNLGRGDSFTQVEFIVVGDVHFPWSSEKALNKIIKQIKKDQPKYVVQIGDLYDFYCFSKYMRSLNEMTPKEEVERGLAMAKSFWKRVRKAAPNAKCYQILGNHDHRMFLRIMESVPEFEHLLGDVKKGLFSFEGVKTTYDPREELYLNGVCFTHGHLTNIGAHAKKIGMPTVVGHSHRGGIISLQGPGNTHLWELNAGWVGDRHANVFNYRALKKANYWTVGYGKIVSHSKELYPAFVEFDEDEL